MKLSEQTLTTWNRQKGSHKAKTFSFDNEKERDKFNEQLKKEKSIFLTRKKKVRNEFWVTAHYSNKEDLPESRGFRFFGE